MWDHRTGGPVVPHGAPDGNGWRTRWRPDAWDELAAASSHLTPRQQRDHEDPAGMEISNRPHAVENGDRGTRPQRPGKVPRRTPRLAHRTRRTRDGHRRNCWFAMSPLRHTRRLDPRNDCGEPRRCPASTAARPEHASPADARQKSLVRSCRHAAQFTRMWTVHITLPKRWRHAARHCRPDQNAGGAGTSSTTAETPWTTVE